MRTNLADTVVVKETQSSTKVSGVVPVISSHCAGVVPPVDESTSGHWSTRAFKPTHENRSKVRTTMSTLQ
jgi:hypothetical protein